jgi:glycosyltransferase involved in cell wall biosynthesis
MYRVGLFRELVRQGAGRGIDVQILVWATDIATRGWRANLAADLPLHVAASAPLDARQRVSPSKVAGTVRLLRRLRPEMVLSTGFGLATAGAMVANQPRPHVLVWSEAIPRISLDLNRARLWQRRRLTSLAAAFVVPGSEASDYAKIVRRDKRILRLPNCVDVALFRPSAEPIAKRPIRVISVGRLDPDKAIPSLLPAIRMLQAGGMLGSWTVIGDGAAAEDFVQTCEQQLGAAFGWRRSATSAEIADALRRSDVFVLTPHVERWGFAVQEAVLTGLPVVVSNQVGCLPDLVRIGKTGYTLPPPPRSSRPDWIESLCTAVRMASRPSVRSEARAHANALRERWSPAASARRFLDDLEDL